MTRRLDAAEASARQAVEEWVAAATTCAAQPGLSALTMFEVDQQMFARVAEAYDVDTPTVAAFWSAYGLAWARGSVDATWGFASWMMPWASADVREIMLKRMTERFGEMAITGFRVRSQLS